jgi:hypothetical protein
MEKKCTCKYIGILLDWQRIAYINHSIFPFLRSLNFCGFAVLHFAVLRFKIFFILKIKKLKNILNRKTAKPQNVKP